MADQSITNGEDGVCLSGRSDCHIQLNNADDEATDNVDCGDNESGDSVTTDELMNRPWHRRSLSLGPILYGALASAV